MPEFNPTEYFNERAAGIRAADAVDTPSDRFRALENSLVRARDGLLAGVEGKRQALERSKESLVGKFGLTHESTAGQLTNLAASAYSGTSRAVGDMAGFVAGDLPAMLSTLGLSNHEMDAINRVKLNNGTFEDQDLVNRKDPRRFGGTHSPMEMFDSAMVDRKRSAGINEAFDRSNLVEMTHRNRLNDDLGANFQSSWDQLTDGAKAVWNGDITGFKKAEVAVSELIFNAGEAAVTHPLAAAEYVFENLPPLAMGALGKVGKAAMLLSNVGYASENYQQGITKYQDENSGAMPPLEERHKMAAIAASLALAEHAADLGQLKAASGAANAVEGGAKTGLIQSTKNIAKAAADGGLEETLTEGYQTWGEGRVNGTPATAKDIYIGGVIGGISGAGLAGGGRAVGEVLKATPEHAQERAINQTRSEAQAAATVSGDVTALTDPKSPVYAPEKAVAALHGNTASPDATPESKQANLEKANSIVADLEAEQAKAQETYDRVSPEALQRYQDGKAKAIAEGKTELAASYQEDIASIDPKQTKGYEQQLTKVNKRLELARESMTLFHQDSQSLEVDTAAQAEVVNTKLDEADTAAVDVRTKATDTIINLSMAIPERLDTAVATSLAENQDNGLTGAQRTYFREFSAARVAENVLKDMGKVSQEIYAGGNGNVGLVQYRARVAQALATGNKAQAEQQLATLTKFEADHRAKADLSAQALEQQQKTGQPVQVIRNTDKTWAINTGKLLNKDAATANGAVTIHTNTPASLIPSFKTESLAITAILSELNAAYAVKFSTKPVPVASTGVSNVPNVSKPPAVPQAVKPVEQAPQTMGSVGASKADRGATPAGVGTPEVGAVGVKQSVRVNVWHGSGENAHLSNLAARPFELDGHKYLSVEHAYQTLKSGAFDPATFGKYKTAGQKIQGRVGTKTAGGWNLSLMKRLVDESFSQNPAAAAALIATGDSQITHSQDTGVWANEFPRVLTGVRQKLAGVVAPVSQSTSSTPVDSPAAPLAAVTPVERANGEQQSTKATVADAAVTESSKSAEQTTETASDTVTEPSGKLTVMASKSAEGTAYHARNLIADYFTQAAVKEGDATERPLNTVQDFLSKGWESAKNFVQFDTLSDAQTEVLRVFKEKATGWAETIQKNLARRNQDFWFDDMPQFLIHELNGKLDMDENVKTAMSYAAFSYIGEQASRTNGNTDEEINLILGRDEDHPVEKHERDALQFAGTRQNVVGNALGQRALQALGLKANKDAKGDLMPKLTAQLGAHIFKMLMDEGLLVRTEISAVDMAALTGSAETSATATHQFLLLAKGKTDEVFKAQMGTQGMLDKLFGVESGLKEPSLVPVPFTQNTTRNTSQQVPSKLAEIVEHENAGASFVRQDMYALMNHLDRDIALQIAGGQTVDPTETHLVNRPSNAAKNDGLGRELDRILGFLGTMGDVTAPLYFEHSVYKQQRVGIITNVVNPQTSKIHRHTLYRATWESKVTADNLENFQLRVAEGLGIKTDKQSNEKSLEAFQKRVNDPKIQAAVAVLQKLDGGQLTKAEQETLLAGVQAGGEDMKSLDSLMALAHQANAKGEDFTIQMMGEVDGVTNGPMLSHLLMGAANTVEELFALLNRGGFFEQGSEHENYNLWREATGHFDLYETTAGHMVTAVQGLINTGIKNSKGKPVMSGPRVGQVMQAIYGFTGTLADKDGKIEKAGRNIIKTPLTAMVFGSSVGAAVESMANKFIESIYAGIEDTAKEVKGAQTREQLLENLALLGVMLPTKMTIAELMEHEFKGDQLDALKKVFKQTVGAAVRSTMEKDFAPFIEKRRQFNLAAQTSFELYNAVRTGLRDELLKGLIASGDIEVNPKTGKPLHDMTAAQEAVLNKRLAKMVPVMNTLMSKDSGSLKAGLAIQKSARKLSDRSTYEGEVKFGTGFADNGAKSTKARGYETSASGPGVAMAPMSVHSTDSAISHNAIGKTEVLNVHDAHGSGLDTFIQTGQNLNRATWDAMLRYSPASEMFDALSRTVEGLAGLIQEGNLPPVVMKNVLEALTKLADKQKSEPNGFLTRVVGDMKATAFKADDMKLHALSIMQAIDQYALQGGEYKVTDANRAEAASLREALSNVVSPSLTAAALVIDNKIGDALVGRSGTVTPLEEDAPPGKSGVFGELGKSNIKHDAALVAWFEANPKPTIGQVIQHLNVTVTGGFNKQLLRLLNKTINKTTVFQWITPGMTGADVIEPPSGGARGWFVTNTKTGAAEINILSTGFSLSGVTPEVVLHEMVHAALWQVVNDHIYLLDRKPGEKVDPNGVGALVIELDELRLKAFAYARKNNLGEEFREQLRNMQEFLAYGMTDQRFQEVILKQISMPSKTEGNALVSGMKAFIGTITKMLFGPQSGDMATNGMAVFLSNVSGLFNEVGSGASTKGRGANVNLSMATDPIGTVNSFSTLDIHNALNAGSVTPAFDLHLRDVLTTIVEKLQGPFGAIRAIAKQNQALSHLDVWIKALDTGVAPFASSVQGSPLKASQQEEFAMEMVEATVRAALERDEVSVKSVYRQLDRLYSEMRDTLKGTMPQAEYDFFFKVEQGVNNRSNYLARFAAFGLAHEGFNKALQVETSKVDMFPKQKTIAEKLRAVFEAIVEFFHDKVAHTYAGQQADEKLTALVGTLVDIEAKKVRTLAMPDPGMGRFAIMEKAFNATMTAKFKTVRAIAKSDNVANSRFAPVRIVGKLALLSAPQAVEAVVQGMSAVRSKNFEGRLGFVAGTMNYAIGASKQMEALLRNTKKLEGERKDIITNRSQMVLQAFSNEGKDLAKEGTELGSTSASITSVFLRTGLHVLTGQFSLGEIEHMLGDKPAVQAAINTLEAQLAGFGRFKDEFIDKANALAYHKTTGEVRIEALLMNAHNIARLAGSPYRGQLTEAQSIQAEPVIEKLVALYALGYTDAGVLKKAQQALQTENARTDGGNGISFVMALQKRLEDESKARNFHGNAALMVHGFTPEIYTPHTDVKTVTEAEGAKLEGMGYSKLGKVALDPADPNQEAKFVYVLNDAGLMPYLTGIVVYDGLNAKGGKSKAHSGYMNVNTADGLTNASKQADIMNAKSFGLYKGPRRDFSKATKSYMAPVLNESGEIVNWRYMMQDSTKDTVLKRDNRFNMVLGVLAGSVFYKETVAETNLKAMQALKEQFDLDKKVSLEGYVLIGPKSTNAEDRETWNMLPETTKAEVRRIWGTDGLRIHHNARDIVFGYRKLSLADAITRTEERREWAAMGIDMPKGGWDDQIEVVMSRLFTEAAEMFFGKKAATQVRRGERVWQEIVSEAKDTIVVKSFSTMVGNIKSNVSLLVLSGVPPWAILKHHLTAWRGATSYERDSKELDRLQTLIDTKHTNGKEAEMKVQVVRLKNAIARNPVRLLIENGLMPSIVEDTTAEDDIYSYKSLLARKVSKVSDKLPEVAVDAAKFVYMSKDSKAYQTLRHITQLSDFMARYTQYQHLTTRRVNPLSKEDAIQQASDDFVNYDIPMHRGMQYLDDTGIFMFSKYYIRIQKVISRMFKENTSRMLGAILLGQFMDLGPIVLDSSWVHKLGNNPLNWGALQYPGSLDELATVKAAMALIK